MKTQIYAIFDTAAGVYQKPFFGLSDGEVKRSFMDVCTSADHPVGKHPEDYSLYRLGNFDDNTGLLINEDNECLCTAHEIISQSRNIDPAAMAALEQRVNSLDPETINPGLTD